MRQTQAPETVHTRNLKGSALALPESSPTRAIILALPDEVSLTSYLDRAEMLAAVLYNEMRAAEAAKASIPTLRQVAKSSLVAAGVPA